MPWEAPRYLMGVGRPLDLVEAVARGVDMFDCVIQTRHARSGVMWTWHGRVRITDRRYRKDMRPLDERCACTVCRTFTRAYLHHLFEVGEILGAVLASVHNIAWFQQFMGAMRESVIDGTFETFRAQVRDLYPDGAPEDPEGRVAAAEALDTGEGPVRRDRPPIRTEPRGHVGGRRGRR